jgi:hypothetical protein
MPASFSSTRPISGIGAHALGQEVGEQDRAQAVAEGEHGDGRRHHAEGQHALVAGRVDEQREEGHVEHDGLGVQQGDEKGLLEIVARLDVQHRRAPGLASSIRAQPSQVGGAQPLDRVEGRRVGHQQGGHAGHCRPHEHLVAGDDAEGRPSPPRMPPLPVEVIRARLPGPGNGEKNQDRGDERAVVCNAKHGEPSRGRLSLLPPAGWPVALSARSGLRIQTMQRSASSPGTLNCST